MLVDLAERNDFAERYLSPYGETYPHHINHLSTVMVSSHGH